jgi:hypothetical protein
MVVCLWGGSATCANLLCHKTLGTPLHPRTRVSEAMQAEQEERRLVVQRKTYCRVCGKWLGDSILVVLPDNTPLHKFCYRGAL